MPVRNHFIIAMAFYGVKRERCSKRNSYKETHMPFIHCVNIRLC